jgi:CHU_C Type IX secretion signal domain
VNAGNNVSICPGIPTTLGASGASTYSWSPATGLTGANTATPSANPASTQTYTVTGTDANGCQNTDQVSVTVFPQPVVTASATSPIIECQTAQLTASGLVSYNWINTAGPDASIATPNASTTDVGPLSNATYAVAGLDANGCAGGASVSVSVNPITVSIVNATTVNPSTFSFDVTSNATNFDWDFYTDGTTDASTTSTNIQHSYPTAPTPPLDYIITTVTASIGNCEAQDTIHVYIDNTLLEWPNIVIADGDGVNDVLSFLSQDPTLQPNWASITAVPTITNFKVEIFNRWGKKVGEVNDPTGSWDPKESGAGVYFYVVSYTKRSTGMSAEEIQVEQAVEVFVK